MNYQHVLVEHGPIASVTMNRPERRNALSQELLCEITKAIYELDAEPNTRVIILKGSGKGFCAGAELDSLIPGEDIIRSRERKMGIGDLLTAMGKIGKIIISQVHGFALAGGLGIAIASDLTVMAENAVIGLPEIKRGLFPYNVMNPIRRVMPRKRILEMMFTGENITAQQAFEWGLVNFVVPASELDNATLALAAKISCHSSEVIRLGKESFYETQDMEYFNAFGYLTNMLTITAASNDAQEGVRAFFEKRAPIWK